MGGSSSRPRYTTAGFPTWDAAAFDRFYRVRSKLVVSPSHPLDFGVTTGCGTFHHAMTIPKERSHYVLFGADRGGLDRDDAAVVAGKRYFLRRVVCDGCEREQVRFALPLPVRPQARYLHFLGRVGPEFQDHVFIFLPLKRHTIFESKSTHVFVEGGHEHQAVRITEKPLPEALKVVPPRV